MEKSSGQRTVISLGGPGSNPMKKKPPPMTNYQRSKRRMRDLPRKLEGLKRRIDPS
jgi:hypothetical protein